MNGCRRQRGGLIRLLAGGLLLLLVGACSVQTSAQPECLPRFVAAFDIGSGTTRMQVADIAECLDGAPISVLRAETPLGFAADLETHGTGAFSAHMREQATAALQDLVGTARAAGAEQLYGVATAAFRRATNAAELAEQWRDRFGLEIQIIDQDEEGRLAFRMIELSLSPDQPLIVWDIGAGSQQLVWRNPADGGIEHFNSSLAAVSFRELALQELGRPAASDSPNPISADEARRLAELVQARLAGELPGELVELIKADARVVGIGGVHGASLIGQAGLQPGAELSRTRLRQVLDGRIGLDDAAIGGAYAQTQVTNLILVLALMDLYGIDSYQATRADLSDALLITTVGHASPSLLTIRP